MWHSDIRTPCGEYLLSLERVANGSVILTLPSLEDSYQRVNLQGAIMDLSL